MLTSLKKLSLVLLVSALVACGGSGNTFNIGRIDQSATGIWNGTFTETGFSEADLLGFVINGKFYFISLGRDTVYVGTYSVNYSSLNASASLYQINEEIFGGADITGTVTEESTMDGSFTTSYGSFATFSLTYDTDATDRGSSLLATDGVWSQTVDSDVLTIAIDLNGIITGSDTAGCVYNGDVSVIDLSKNIYLFDITLTSCGIFNGTYSGYGVISDDVSANDTLTYVMENENFLLYRSLTKQ